MSDVFSSPLSVAIAAAVGGALAAISISNALSNLGAAAQQGGFSRGGRRRSERQDDEHRRQHFDYDSEGGKFVQESRTLIFLACRFLPHHTGEGLRGVVVVLQAVLHNV